MCDISAKSQMLSLKDIVDPKRGMTYNADQLTEADGSALAYFNMKSFLKSGGLNANGTKWFSGRVPPEFLLDESDVIIANTDVTPGSDIIGSAAHVPSEYVGKATFSHHVTRLRVKSQAVVPPFLSRALLLERVRRAMRAESRGTTVKMLDIAGALAIEVRVLPLEEQSLVISILDTIDTAIHETEAIIAKLKAVKQGLLHDLLTRGIDANGELRPPQAEAPHLYKESPLGWIPKDWEVSTLSGLGIDGLINGVFKEPGRVGSGVPLVNVADLYRGESVSLDECERFAATDIERSRYSARRGDIFFTRSSLKLEGIAQTSFLAVDTDSAVFECHVMRLRPNNVKVAPRFLKEWCVGIHARKHFMANAKQVTMTTISQDGIASLTCPRPPLYRAD